VEEHDFVREIYAASAGRLVSQVYAMTGDFAEAQDAVQDAFARAVARPGKFAGLENPEAWLRTVALNFARSRHRRRKVFERLVSSGAVARNAHVVPGLTADHVALVAALQKLSRPVREAIVLHHLADLPVAEVARQLNCSVEAVKARLVRGRRALAEYLNEMPSGEQKELYRA
jgi:RNA polymerase sigma factor (sigma-70 family)